MDCVPLLLVLAVACRFSDSNSKAMATLKRIAKISYEGKFDVEFGQATLMQANILLNGGDVCKRNVVEELCNKCLSCNKSNYNAYYLLGIVKERYEQYEEASEFFRTAWEIVNFNSAMIGFKLASNLFRNNSFLETIEVCDKILSRSPNFKRARSLLNQSIGSLRP